MPVLAATVLGSIIKPPQIPLWRHLVFFREQEREGKREREREIERQKGREIYSERDIEGE